jgi:hypothetical protein
MNRNISSTDQKLRVAGGAVAGALSVVVLGVAPLPPVLSPVLGVIALIMIATATVGTCPIYSALGVSSRSRDSLGSTTK